MTNLPTMEFYDINTHMLPSDIWSDDLDELIQYDDPDADFASTPESSNTPDTPEPQSAERSHEPNSQTEPQQLHSSDSVASAASPAGSLTEPLDVNAANQGAGLPSEVIASYIGGPDEDGAWICTFEDCSRKFNRKENIKSHIQTHLNDRQYQCPACQKCFVRQHDLRRHHKTHSGDKSFKCPCGTGFVRQDALTRHRKRGMCAGAFDGYPKATGKRGRPRKERPQNETTAKVTKPRQKRTKNLSVSSVASYFSHVGSVLDSPIQLHSGLSYEPMASMASSAPMPMASPELLPVHSQSLPQQQLTLSTQFLPSSSADYSSALSAAFSSDGINYYSKQMSFPSPTDASFSSPEYLDCDQGFMSTDAQFWLQQP